MRDTAARITDRRGPHRARLFGLLLLVATACSPGGVDAAPPGGPSSVGVPVDDLQVVAPSSGRFRYHLEVGAVGYGVLDTVIDGEFDEEARAFEMTLDLGEVAGAVPGLVDDPAMPLAEHLIIRGVVGRVFVRAEPSDRGWILFPGAIDETVADMGVHRPDAMLAVLDRSSDGVVASDGGAVDGAATTRFSGWIRGDALGDLSSGDGGGLESLSGVASADLFDRLVRFDVWVDEAGRARRLVIEADLESMAAVARRIDGTDAEVDRLRLRHDIEWYDLDAGVTVEPPPRDQVSVIDVDALERDGGLGPTS